MFWNTPPAFAKAAPVQFEWKPHCNICIGLRAIQTILLRTKYITKSKSNPLCGVYDYAHLKAEHTGEASDLTEFYQFCGLYILLLSR